jgi:predicted kinase
VKNAAATSADAELFRALLESPDAEVPWGAVAARPWWRAMADCPQDPVHHAEGDVATHTRLVVDALRGLPAWRVLPDDERGLLLLTALLHDIAKPETTRTEDDGRVTARGHSGRGEVRARRMLWEAGIPFAVRERVCAIIRYHQHPFWLITRAPGDARRVALAISHSAARADLLAIHAEADALGRVCADREAVLLNVACFRELCAEHGCLIGPYPFPSDHARFLYFRSHDPERDPAYAAHDDTRAEMLLLSGLPGSGKDTYLRTEHLGLPVVSLDALRAELGVSPKDNQEAVAAAARERAKAYLRRGEPFAWNATSLSRELRALCIDVAATYRARVRIVYVEVPARVQQDRNRRRETAVPDAAVERMYRRWEVPDLTEAHGIEWRVTEA